MNICPENTFLSVELTANVVFPRFPTRCQQWVTALLCSAASAQQHQLCRAEEQLSFPRGFDVNPTDLSQRRSCARTPHTQSRTHVFETHAVTCRLRSGSKAHIHICTTRTQMSTHSAHKPTLVFLCPRKQRRGHTHTFCHVSVVSVYGCVCGTLTLASAWPVSKGLSSVMAISCISVVMVSPSVKETRAWKSIILLLNCILSQESDT